MYIPFCKKFAFCENNPVNFSDPNGNVGEAIAGSLWWFALVDGPLPIGDILYGVAIGLGLIIDSILIFECVDELENSYPQTSLAKEKEKNHFRSILLEKIIGKRNIMKKIKNPWLMLNWKEKYDRDLIHRKGICFVFDKGLNPDVVRSIKSFSLYLKSCYQFPIRVNIHIKNKNYIQAFDGEHVSATCFTPFDIYKEPFIRISAGDFDKLKMQWGKNNALASILHSIAHEITHYYQWINSLDMDTTKSEWQASYYATIAIRKYAETRDEP